MCPRALVDRTQRSAISFEKRIRKTKETPLRGLFKAPEGEIGIYYQFEFLGPFARFEGITVTETYEYLPTYIPFVPFRITMLRMRFAFEAIRILVT